MNGLLFLIQMFALVWSSLFVGKFLSVTVHPPKHSWFYVST